MIHTYGLTHINLAVRNMRAVAEVERAGGRLLRRGEFAKGSPYAYISDPDGHEIEIWFE